MVRYLPPWLVTPTPVVLRRNVQSNNYETLVDEIQLFKANPQDDHMICKI